MIKLSKSLQLKMVEPLYGLSGHPYSNVLQSYASICDVTFNKNKQRPTKFKNNNRNNEISTWHTNNKSVLNTLCPICSWRESCMFTNAVQIQILPKKSKCIKLLVYVCWFNCYNVLNWSIYLMHSSYTHLSFLFSYTCTPHCIFKVKHLFTCLIYSLIRSMNISRIWLDKIFDFCNKHCTVDLK